MKDHWSDIRVVVTGGTGFLGRCVCHKLRGRGVSSQHLLVPRHKEYDLTVEPDVARMYQELKPDLVIHLAAKVGGVGANQDNPGVFFYANMAMGLHLIEHARRMGVRKFVHTGTICAYPKLAPIPFKESDLWNGYPEETNAPYAISKKSLAVMLDAYWREYGFQSAVVLPVNLYGPGDNFDPKSGHVIAALIRKCDLAAQRGDEEITCWGTGSPSREFLYVQDAAEGIVLAAEKVDQPNPINLGTGQEIRIDRLVAMIAKLCGYTGHIRWDTSKPDGQPHRRVDITRAKQMLDWEAHTSLEEGLRTTITWWQEHRSYS